MKESALDTYTLQVIGAITSVLSQKTQKISIKT